MRAALLGADVLWGVLSLASIAAAGRSVAARVRLGGRWFALGGWFDDAAVRDRSLALPARWVAPTASAILLAVGAAWMLLGEAMLAVAFADSWRASWWEWHLLMLAIAFATMARCARRRAPRGALQDLYLDEIAARAREVSVLFADLEGYTTFAEGRDPSEV